MGTPIFAIPTFKTLMEDSDFNIVGVFSQPDRIKGRGLRIQASPVKEIAEEMGIKCFQPQKLIKDEIDEIWPTLKPDVIVVVAYGHILPHWMLTRPPMGCINLHASLLPLYRGAAPINWAIINGEKETGITIMLMDNGMDTGPILFQKKIVIRPSDTAGTLHDHLSSMGAQLMVSTLKGYASGRIVPREQPKSGESYAPKLEKATGYINWKRGNITIWNLIKGLTPIPLAYTFLADLMLKIWRAETIKGEEEEKDCIEPGQICSLDNQFGLVIQTGKGKIGLLEIQPENKKRMTAKSFVNGCRINPIGKVLKSRE